MRVLVTGGAGFIGANLCRRLADGGAERVVVLDDLSTGSAANLDGVAVEFVEGSILDDETVTKLVGGVDAVVHLAALGSVPRSVLEPVASHAVNATGTVVVLDAARRADVGHVIVASSSSVYGANPVLPKREDLAQLPVSPYAASKLATEAYSLAYGHSYGLPVLALRFFNVFGPLQAAGHAYAAVIPVFVEAALAGRPLPVHGDGTQSRDFTYVDTVTGVIADALVRRVSHPEPVNLALGTRTDLLTVIAVLERVLGRELSREHGPRRPGDVDHSQADATRLRSLFPDVDAVPLEAALAATVAWVPGATGLSMRGHGAYDATKRCFDVVAATVGLVVLSPLLLAIAVLVRFTIGSPVVFRQERPGRFGVPFELLKFRTMTDARGPDGELLPDGDRLTRVGQWLRRTSLDELPELLNVLRGEMSIVGPRPLLMQYLPLYSPEQARRHDVRPGITGWAQVNGRNATTWDERFANDLWYVEHRSMQVDLDILRRTIAEVWHGRGISHDDAVTMPFFTGSAPSSPPAEEVDLDG